MYKYPNLPETGIIKKKQHRKAKALIVASVLLAILMLITCFTTACQPNPEQAVVIGQNNDITESAASGDFKIIETPEHIAETYDQFPKLKITYDTDVIVPETTAYPVTEVKKRIFTDDDILSFIKIYSGNSYLYSEWNLTKDEWLQKISKAKKYEGTEKVTKEYLDYLQQQFESAAAEVKNPPLTINELPTDTESKAYAKIGNNTVSEFLFTRNENSFIYFRDMNMVVQGASLFMDEETKNAWYKPGEPEISKDEAYNKALEYMKDLDIDLNLYYAEPCSVLVDLTDLSTGWQFTFTRAISNLQSQYHDDTTYVNPEALPSYGAPWQREMCRIAIDKEGLCELWWQGASKISRTVTDSAQLKEFETIKQRITDQLNYIYGTSENGTGNGLDIEITKIELGISLISVKDQTDTGDYLPTWYVSFNYKWRDVNEWYPAQIMFNATDGSYIEPRITNTDLMANNNANGVNR